MTRTGIDMSTPSLSTPVTREGEDKRVGSLGHLGYIDGRIAQAAGGPGGRRFGAILGRL